MQDVREASKFKPLDSGALRTVWDAILPVVSLLSAASAVGLAIVLSHPAPALGSAGILGLAVSSACLCVIGVVGCYRRRVHTTDITKRIAAQVQTDSELQNRLDAETERCKRYRTTCDARKTQLEQAAYLTKLGRYVWDVERDCLHTVSERHAAHFGLTQETFRSAAASRGRILDLVHPDDRKKLGEAYQKLRSGSPIEVEYRVAQASGQSRVREVARPIFDEAKRVVREVSSTLDITDMHETEIKLFEAQKMDGIGKLTGGVAHDFNNLLAVILGNLELLKEFPDAPDRDQMIADAIGAVGRGRDLTMSMLSFARRAPLDPTSLDLNAIVADMYSLLRRTLPARISLETSLSDVDWPVFADQSLTESAILNLVINARDSMSGGGFLTLATAPVTIRADQADAPPDLEPGEYVSLAVSDTGTGIAPDLVDHIFEPFFTTKAMAKNSGLGLSMVQGFMRQIGGSVSVSTAPGRGTCFTLYFKVAEADVSAPIRQDSQMTFAAEHSMRLLLIEDEPSVRTILARHLTSAGADVKVARDGAEALLTYRQDGPFDAVVSDMILPGDQQGADLLELLRGITPGLPAVMLSGSPEEQTQANSDPSPRDLRLMKPVARNDLIRAVEAVLGSDAKPITPARLDSTLVDGA